MRQLCVNDFFKPQPAPKSSTHTVVDFTEPDRDPVEKDQVDNISFHSFTVFGGHRSDITPLHQKPVPATCPGFEAHSAFSDAKVRQRKISDFNEYMLDKESTVATSNDKQSDIVGRLSNRQPFSQIQIRPVPTQPQTAKKNPAKLDDFFKSTIMIQKPNACRVSDDSGEASLGKRKQSGEEDKPLPAKPTLSKKSKPMDNFVVRIKRNNVSTCCL